MASRIASLALFAAGVAAQPPDVGYNLLFQTASEEFSDRCVTASRNLPPWLSGDFVIGSVGQQEMGDRHFVGYLDAFGKYSKFSLKGGQVCATYRMMRTGFYNESVKSGTIGHGLLFYETEPPRHCPVVDPVCDLPPMAPNDNTFVNTFMHNGQLLSLTDAPYMITMDPKSLNVTGTKKWDDNVAGAFSIISSAHPVKHQATDEFLDYVGNQNFLTGKVELQMFGISDKHADSRMPKGSSVEMSSAPYMHSFGITEKYAILPRMPVKFGLPLGKSMQAAFTDLEMQEPGPDNAFHVVPLEGGETIVIPLPLDEKLYYIHEANAYETESGLVIDLSTAPTNVFSGDLTTKDEQNKTFRDGCYHDPLPCINTVKRFHLPLTGKGFATSEIISDPRVKTDFLKINERYKGKRHCFYWAVQWFSDYSSKASMAIVKYNTCTSGSVADTKLQWSRKHWYPSEAFMVPSPGGAEDDGVLIFTALDGSTGQTYLQVVNATTMEDLAEAGPFPRIAFTTHGEFYSSTRTQAKSEHSVII